MKQIPIILISLIACNSSFAAHNVPSLQKRLQYQINISAHKNDQERCKVNQQKTMVDNSTYPKISQEKLNKWVATKEREIKENKAKAKFVHKKFGSYKQEKQNSSSDYAMDPHMLSRQCSHVKKCLRKAFTNDLRRKYYPKTKSITCYPLQLLLEEKKQELLKI
jgi:hypothetical protein